MPSLSFLSVRDLRRGGLGSISLALALALMGCHGGSFDTAGSRKPFITGGQATTGFPAVGLLIVGNSMCTATLVGRKTVLTAAHCVANVPMTFMLDNGERFAVTKAVRPAEYGGEGTSYDIAVAILGAAPPVAPMPLATRAPRVGETITLVGYGATLCQEINATVVCTEDAGVKREATNTVSFVTPLDFIYNGEGSTCKGDSGGPAFALQEGQQVQLGVTSRGVLPCGVEATDTRVDVFGDWLHEVADGDVVFSAPQIQPPEPDTSLPQLDSSPTPQLDSSPAPQLDTSPAPQLDMAAPPHSDAAPTAHPDAGLAPQADAQFANEPIPGALSASDPETRSTELVGGCATSGGGGGELWLLVLVCLALWRRQLCSSWRY
ncbi:MAG: trypsin-like serine protease, partial [Deltaproteobacteria bacterium]|nr:trypsin-like serine protease [Deltaproteobacteria bacterium]